MSSVEVLNFLKKSLGVIMKRMEEKGVLSTPSFLDHSFIPELTVPDSGVTYSLSAMLYKLKVIDNAPVYFNIDRPITDTEYSIVFPGSYKIIPRIGSTLYLKAPTGFTTKVMIEALR